MAAGQELASGENVCLDVCINEVMTNADGPDQGIFPQGEWVELYNSGSEGVSLEGWAIVDIGGWYHPINEQTWVGFEDLDSPFILEPGEFAVIAENEIGTLRLNNGGETIFHRDSGNMTIDEIETGVASNGVSKIADSTNNGGVWVDSETPSPGYHNPGNNGGAGPIDVQISWWDGD